MEANTDHKPAPYIRRRAFSKVHIQSWLIYLERDGFVRCSFQNCNFMAFDVEEMGDHYAFCKGFETAAATFVCTHCQGRATSAKKLQIHLARAHNVTGSQTSTSVLEAEETKNVSLSKKTIEGSTIEKKTSANTKPSRVLLASWQCFYDSNNYVKCANCSYIGNTVREMSRHYHFCKQEKEMLLYVCPECKGRTMNVNPLLWHMERSHKLYREASQFNLISRSMLRFWEKELHGKHHATCLHVSKGVRDCFYFADDLLAIIQHSQCCKGPKFSIDKKQCPRCPMWTISDDVLSRHIEISHPKLVVKRDDKAGVEVLTIGPASETIKRKSREEATTQLATITSEVEIIPVDCNSQTEEPRDASDDNHLSGPIGKEDGHVTTECGSDQVRTEEGDIVEIQDDEMRTEEGDIVEIQDDEVRTEEGDIVEIQDDEMRTEEGDVVEIQDDEMIILSKDSLPGTVEIDEKSSVELIKGEELIKRSIDNLEAVVTSFKTKIVSLSCKNKLKRPIEETYNSKVIDLAEADEDHACARMIPALKSITSKNRKEKNEIALLDKNNSLKFRQTISEENNHYSNKLNKVNGSDEEFEEVKNLEVDSQGCDVDNVSIVEVKNEDESAFPDENAINITDDKSTKELKMETSCGLFEDEPSVDTYDDDLLTLDTDNRNIVEGTKSDINEQSDKIDLKSCPKNYLRRHIFNKADRFSPIKRPSTSTAKGDPKHLRDRLEGPETVNITSSNCTGAKNESFKNQENSTVNFEHNKNSQKLHQIIENCVKIGSESAEEISKCSEKNDKLMLLNSGSLDISENCILPDTPSGDASRSGIIDGLVNSADIRNRNNSDLLIARPTKFLKCVGIGSKTSKDIKLKNSLNKCLETHLVTTVETEANDSTSKIPSNSEQINSNNKKNNPDENKDSFFSMKTYNIKKGNCWKIEYDSYESDTLDDLDCEESTRYEKETKIVSFYYQGKFAKHVPEMSKSNGPTSNTILKQNSHQIELPFCKKVDSKNEERPGLCSSSKSGYEKTKSDCHQTACGKGTASFSGKMNKTPLAYLNNREPNTSVDSKMLTDDSIDEFTSQSSRRISSDWCEDSSNDEEFLGTDEELDMKDQLFNGFQDVTEKSCSMNRRFHQFLNRLSESENEEWYVNAGNLSMEVRKQEQCMYGKPPSKLPFHSTHNPVKTKSIFEKPVDVESKDVLIRSGVNRNKENHQNEVNSQSYISENLLTSQFKSPSYFSHKGKVCNDESKCMDKAVHEGNTQVSDNKVEVNNVGSKRSTSCNKSTSSNAISAVSDIKNFDHPESSLNLITKSSIIATSAKRKIGRPPKKLDLTGSDSENKRTQDSEIKNDKQAEELSAKITNQYLGKGSDQSTKGSVQKESHVCLTTASEGKHTDKLRRKSENMGKGNRVLPSIIVSKPLDLVNNNASGSNLISNANMIFKNPDSTDDFKIIKEDDKNVKQPLNELIISQPPTKESRMTTEVTPALLVEQSATQNALSGDKHFIILQTLQTRSNNKLSQIDRKTSAALSDTLEDSDDNDNGMIIDEDNEREDLDGQSATTSQELMEVFKSGEVGTESKQIDPFTESGLKKKEPEEMPSKYNENKLVENHFVANMETKTATIESNIPSPKKRERKQSLKILREEIEPIVISSSDKADDSLNWKKSTNREKRKKINELSLSKTKSEDEMSTLEYTLVKNGRSAELGLIVSSTPKRRGRPPKKIVNMKPDFLPGDDSSTENEILISIYSEEAYRILQPSSNSQSLENLQSLINNSVAKETSVTCESDKEKSSRVNSDIATFLVENISDSSFNASCVAESTPLPKKRRGRPPKVKPELHLSTVTNESSLSLKPGQDSAEIINQTVGPKRRGRKPKLKQEQSKSEPVRENEGGLNEGKSLDNLSIHVPKRRGRPPKSKVNTVNLDNKEFTPKLIKNDILNDSSVNLESEVDSEIYIPKKRGRKPKQVPPIDETQNSCIIPENKVDSLISIPKKRGRKPKQIQTNNQSDDKESVVQSTPKRRGRPPKRLVENYVESEEKVGVKKGSKRQFYEEDHSDEENSESSSDDFYKRKISQRRPRIPPTKKKLPFNLEDPFFRTRHEYSDRVVCGVCKEEMTYHTYKVQHAIFKHYMLCWLHEEENPVDMNNDKEIVNRLWYAKKRLKAIPFRCFACNLPKLSAVGFQSHIRFCGRDAERESLLVTCELCGAKLMPSSLNAHNYMKHNSNMSVQSVDPALIIPRMKRAAANRAVEVIQSQTDDGDPGESRNKSFRSASPDAKHFLSHMYSKPSKIIPPDEYSRWKTSLQDTTIVECLHPQCNFTANSTVAFRKHYFTCKFSPPRLFRCKKCEFASQEETRVQDHVVAHHQSELEDAWSDSDGSEGSEGENLKKSNLPIIPFKFLNKLNRGLPKRHFYIEALDWTQELREETLSTEELFKEALPSAGSWQPLSQQQAASHLPLTRNSLRFRGSGDTWQTLRRFDATLVDGVPMIFTGGPVWASAWAPVPDTEVTQYLAVASHPSMEHTHQMSSVYNYKSLIQIWSFGHLSNTDPHSGETPRFLLGLCHSRGSVWGLQWCPSGCYQPSRLGLLAAACSDGSIAIYAIPRYRFFFESVQEYTMYNVQPVLELKLGCEMMSQCKCLDWHSVAPHSLIVGGFANGMVAIWDLTTTSPLLREGTTIYPFKVIEAHLSAVTAVSLSPTPQEEVRLMTASFDRATKFWRLEDTTKPVTCLRKASVTDAVQPANWLTAISSYDDVFSINSSHITGVNYRETFQASNTNYHLQPATVWSLSFNDWLNVCACASEVGKVSVFFRQQILVTEDSKKVKRQSPIGEIMNCSVQSLNSWSQAQGYGISYSEAVSNVGLEIKFNDDIFDWDKAQNVSSCDNMDRYPLLSINKVTWNPNFHSFTWMAVGMQCGLVLAPRLKNIPSRELTQLYDKNQDDR